MGKGAPPCKACDQRSILSFILAQPLQSCGVVGLASRVPAATTRAHGSNRPQSLEKKTRGEDEDRGWAALELHTLCVNWVIVVRSKWRRVETQQQGPWLCNLLTPLLSRENTAITPPTAPFSSSSPALTRPPKSPRHITHTDPNVLGHGDDDDVSTTAETAKAAAERHHPSLRAAATRGH